MSMEHQAALYYVYSYERKAISRGWGYGSLGKEKHLLHRCEDLSSDHKSVDKLVTQKLCLLMPRGSSNFKASLKLLSQVEIRCSTGQRKRKRDVKDQSLIHGLLCVWGGGINTSKKTWASSKMRTRELLEWLGEKALHLVERVLWRNSTPGFILFYTVKDLLQLEDTQSGFLLVTLGILIPSEDLSVFNIHCVPYHTHTYTLPARCWLW